MDPGWEDDDDEDGVGVVRAGSNVWEDDVEDEDGVGVVRVGLDVWEGGDEDGDVEMAESLRQTTGAVDQLLVPMAVCLRVVRDGMRMFPWGIDAMQMMPTMSNMCPTVENYSGKVDLSNVPSLRWILRHVLGLRNPKKRNSIKIIVNGLRYQLEGNGVYVYGSKSIKRMLSGARRFCDLVNVHLNPGEQPMTCSESVIITNTMFMMCVHPRFSQAVINVGARLTGMVQMPFGSLVIRYNAVKFPGMRILVTYQRDGGSKTGHDLTLLVFMTGYIIVHKQKTRERMARAYVVILRLIWELLPECMRSDFENYVSRHLSGDGMVYALDGCDIQEAKDRALYRDLQNSLRRELCAMSDVNVRLQRLGNKPLRFRKSSYELPRPEYIQKSRAAVVPDGDAAGSTCPSRVYARLRGNRFHHWD